jgi:cation diffusion facilitator CzcD-associated flavoprotein CzcO
VTSTSTTAGPDQGRRDVIVVGAGAVGRRVETELRAAGITDVTVLSGRDVASSVFDDGTDTWELRIASGETFRAAVVIAANELAYLPWIPELTGRDEFRGPSFHAGQWDPAFDPTGKRVAVIGTDSAAGHYLRELTQRAASVSVFTHPPRRFVQRVPLWMTSWTTLATRWLRDARAIQKGPRPAVVGAAIEGLTPSGIRTRDGGEHRVDAIVYGTGFAAPDSKLVGPGGLAIQQAWRDGMEPFVGVAVHGFPNYFFISGPDGALQAARTGYVIECIGLMKATASSRIELRRSSQQVFNERAHLTPAEPLPVASAFDLSGIPATDTEIKETYDGAATLTIGDACHPVRVRLAGRLDPIDGHYHWQGTVFSSLSDPLPDEALKQSRAATLTVDGLSAPARIVEQTPWGTHSIAGVGAPPYALNGP